MRYLVIGIFILVLTKVNSQNIDSINKYVLTDSLQLKYFPLDEGKLSDNAKLFSPGKRDAFIIDSILIKTLKKHKIKSKDYVYQMMFTTNNMDKKIAWIVCATKGFAEDYTTTQVRSQWILCVDAGLSYIPVVIDLKEKRVIDVSFYSGKG
jgi:hypothetical protein